MMPDKYEFQFRFGGKMGQKTSFGFDVMAATVAEAIEKSNCFLDSSEPAPTGPDSPAVRVWVNVTRKAVRHDIAAIYDSEGGMTYSVKDFEALELCGLHSEEHCPVCWTAED